MNAAHLHLARPQDDLRSLLLVDLDNMVGGVAGRHRVPNAMARLLSLAEFRSGDHLVVAADRALLRTAAFQLPRGARLLVGRGPDGADRCLLEAVPADLIARRYGRLVVASGDRSMVQLIWSVRQLGTPVVVVGPLDGTASILRQAADRYLAFFVGDRAA